MLKKEYVGKTVHLKHFSVLVCEENIPTLKKLDIDWVFETKKKKKNNPTSGSLDLGSPGFYNYKVYEQNSTTNLDPTGLNKVEEGKMKLIDSTYQPSFTQHSVSPTTNVVYNPGQ